MIASEKKEHLAWQCRRGLLELDLILQPFLEREFERLQPAEKKLFAQLLQQPDPDLYQWLIGQISCPKSDLQPLIEKIRQFKKST